MLLISLMRSTPPFWMPARRSVLDAGPTSVVDAGAARPVWRLGV